MADSKLVVALQEQIDSVTERMKTSKSQLSQLQHKLVTLSDALSEIDDVDAESFNESTGQFVREGAPHLELSAEARQNRERAIRAFNLNPWRGVELIKEETGGSVDDLVAFFIGTPGLNKSRLGEWLGEPLEDKTLATFAYAFPFAEQPLEKALRMYCSKVKLPESSKKVDRLLEAFASAWVSNNADQGLSVDAVHIISFSCARLNLERSSNGKVSEDAFVNNHRGINGGQDCPRHLLLALYRSISKDAMVTPVEQGEGSGILFTSPVKQGWLRKQGGRHSRWARRYFILCDATLFYFENEGDVDPKGFFLLDNLKAVQQEKNQVALSPKVGAYVRSAKFDRTGEMIIGNHKSLIMAAATERDASEWASVLSK